MASFLVSYHLDGARPSILEMDKHLRKLGAQRLRLLDTVWLIAYAGTATGLRDYVRRVLGKKDVLLVLGVSPGTLGKLLKTNAPLSAASVPNAYAPASSTRLEPPRT